MAENGTDPAGPPAHDGPWTEEAYLALDGGHGSASAAGGHGSASAAGGHGSASAAGGRRIELVDGSLLVAPTPDDRHAAAVASVRAAVAAALPEGLEVTGPVALRLAPGRILVPDLVVAAEVVSAEVVAGAAAADAGAEGSDLVGTAAVRDSSVALLVIDVVGRGNGVADRWFKPQLYAGSRIPYALLVDHDEPSAVANMLISGRYHSYAQAEAGEVLRLQEPFDLELPLALLTSTDDSVVEPETTDTDLPAPA